jgi:hypothetical protein
MNIYVSYHTKSNFLQEKGYVPIHVGSKNSKLNLEILRDDKYSDNISDLNVDYCELTATYWAWRNCQSPFIGINHYRRLFSNVKVSSFESFVNTLKYNLYKLFGVKIIENSNFIRTSDLTGLLLEYATAKSYLKKSMIIPSKYLLSTSVKNHFELGNKEYVDVLSQIINNNSNRNFVEVFRKSLKLCYLYPGNILLTHKDEWNEYCGLIFPILMEHRLHFNKTNTSYNRIAGYMGELLTSAFIQYKISKGRRKVELKLLYLESN